MTNLLLWMTFLCMLTASLAATGAKVLTGFPRHELESYCRRRNRRSFFDDILDRHDDLATVAETLLVVAIVATAVLLSLEILPDATIRRLDRTRLLAGAAIAVPILLAVVSWIPNAVVQLWSAPFIYHTWPFWVAAGRVLWPLMLGLQLVNTILHRLAGEPTPEDDEEEAFEDEIRTIVTAGLRDGLLEADAREMIEGVIELGDVDVAEIMTPRSDVDALDVELGWSEMLQYVVEVGRTRIPVYQDRLDQVIGILYVKDLLLELSKPSDAARSS
jgi:CBS domain containing-hemolysin-like protein